MFRRTPPPPSPDTPDWTTTFVTTLSREITSSAKSLIDYTLGNRAITMVTSAAAFYVAFSTIRYGLVPLIVYLRTPRMVRVMYKVVAPEDRATQWQPLLASELVPANRRLADLRTTLARHSPLFAGLAFEGATDQGAELAAHVDEVLVMGAENPRVRVLLSVTSK